MHSCCALLPFTKYSYWWGEAPAGFAAPTLGADQPSRLYLSAPTTHWEESATSDPPGTGWLRSSSVAAVVIFEGDLRLFLNKIQPTPLGAPCHPAPRFGPAAQPALLIVDIIRLLRLRELKLNGLKLIERNPWLGGCDTVSACCKHRGRSSTKM